MSMAHADSPAPAAEAVSTVVVGAGVCGLQAASRLARDGINEFVLLEQQPGLGGVWAPTSWANASSRVQISEPNYRLISENVSECRTLLLLLLPLDQPPLPGPHSLARSVAATLGR